MIFFFLMIRRPPRSTQRTTLFPYTTLFRSPPGGAAAALAESLLERTIPGRTPGTGVRIDATTAALLDARFEIAGDGDDRELVAFHREADPTRRIAPLCGRARERASL